MDAICANVFDFALMFTVDSPKRSTTCETFTNETYTALIQPPCGNVIIASARGQYTHAMELGNLGKYFVELKQSKECGHHYMVLMLAYKKYILSKFVGYKMVIYYMKLRYTSDLHRAFELRSDAVLLHFHITRGSSECTLETYYRRAIGRKPRKRKQAQYRYSVSFVLQFNYSHNITK